VALRGRKPSDDILSEYLSRIRVGILKHPKRLHCQLSVDDSCGRIALQRFASTSFPSMNPCLYLPTHQYYHIPTGAMWAAVSINAKIAPMIENGDKMSASLWLDKHRCAVQATWMPGEPLEIRDRVVNDGGWIDHPGVTCLNLYRPPNVGPGNAKLAGPWIRHCIKVYGKDTRRLINWFAHRVQRPQEKINHALFLGGSPGIGKDSLLAPVINAIGPWNAQDIAPKTLLGQFNTYARAVILRVSEMHDLGDVNRYTFYDASKVYCASPPDYLRVNQKHMQEFYVKNVCGVIYTSNYRDGLYLPPDDRRHDVMWSELVAADFADGYWTKLWSWYSNGGFEHVAAYLMARDISKFDPAAPPPKGRRFGQWLPHPRRRKIPSSRIYWIVSRTAIWLSTRASRRSGPTQ
jgi:hypothetical protein